MQQPTSFTLSRLETWLWNRGVHSGPHPSIEISNLDNPGWHVSICLHGTPLEALADAELTPGPAEDIWMVKVIDGRWDACGPALSLTAILDAFLAFADPSTSTDSGSDSSLDLLSRLERWYLLQCDGDWEHSCGIRITARRREGWTLEIPLERTALAWREARLSAHSWNDQRTWHWSGQRLAAGIHAFFDWAGALELEPRPYEPVEPPGPPITTVAQWLAAQRKKK